MLLCKSGTRDSLNVMTTNANIPALSQKEAIIIGVLFSSKASEMFGLQILDGSSGMLKRGTIYVTLQRMEEKGLISSRQEARAKPEGGIPRRLYRVTAFGQCAFNAYKHSHDRLSLILTPA